MDYCAKESNRETTGLGTNHARGDQWKNLLIVVYELVVGLVILRPSSLGAKWFLNMG